MKLSQIKKIIQEEIQNVLSEKNQPQTSPTKPGHETIEKEPITKPYEPKRHLDPGKEAPDPNIKAKGKRIMKEEEKELVNKIAKRFKNLNR
jgi:hypothetical protein